MQGKIRFAPSPTGYLHEGHLLSALYVWAAAKKWNLKLHLRIEDHDQSRARPAYIAGIREDLAWLGFHYDSESIQSARGPIYETALKKLEEKKLIYPCYCSRKQLLAENPQSETGEIIYQGKCRIRRENAATRLQTRDDNHTRRATRPTQLGMAEPNGWDKSEAIVQRRECIESHSEAEGNRIHKENSLPLSSWRELNKLLKI